MNNEVRPIDANALENHSHPCVRETFGYSAKAEDWMVSVDDIRNEPTLDYEPVRYGHWVPKINNRKYRRGYYCSECGRCVEVISDENVFVEYPYCHCGCKMVKENEDD